VCFTDIKSRGKWKVAQSLHDVACSQFSSSAGPRVAHEFEHVRRMTTFFVVAGWELNLKLVSLDSL
jgi:hypothetical protein